MREIKVKQFGVEETEITLLTREEAEQLPISIRVNGEGWWLRSPYSGTTDFVGSVYTDGNVRGNYVTTSRYARPAFRIANLQSKIGDKVLVGNTWCTCISDDMVLADKGVCEHIFDSESNDWETSELKAFIESDCFKDMVTGAVQPVEVEVVE